MIASRKDRKAENDNYRELARYIADTKNEGEKVLLHWSAGCAFDDYMVGVPAKPFISAHTIKKLKNWLPNWPRPDGAAMSSLTAAP